MKVLSLEECGLVAGGSDPQPFIVGASAIGIALFLIGVFPF